MRTLFGKAYDELKYLKKHALLTGTFLLIVSAFAVYFVRASTYDFPFPLADPYLVPTGTANTTQTLVIEAGSEGPAKPGITIYQLDNRNFEAMINYSPYNMGYTSWGGLDYPAEHSYTNLAFDMSPYHPGYFYSKVKDQISLVNVSNIVTMQASYEPKDALDGDDTKKVYVPLNSQPITSGDSLIVSVKAGGPHATSSNYFANGGTLINPPTQVKRYAVYELDMNVYWKGEARTTKTMNAWTSTPNLAVGGTSSSSVTITTTGYQASAGPVDVNHNTNTTTWTSSNPSVASVNPATGLITGISAGTAVIRATWEKDGFHIYREFTVTVAGGGGGPGSDENETEGIHGDFDVTPPVIHYRDPFSLKPKDIIVPNGCSYVSHRYRFHGLGETAEISGQTTATNYSYGHYPWNIGVGTYTISIKIKGTCGESEWLGAKTLTIHGPANNSPPHFQIGWFHEGDFQSITGVQEVVAGARLMVRLIENPNANPPLPSDPDGDNFSITGWDFSNNAWTRGLPDRHGFTQTDVYLGNILMDTPGYHLIRATMTDELGAQSTASATVRVLPPNPIPIISAPAEVRANHPVTPAIHGNDSYSPMQGRTIDHTRDEWTNHRTVYTTPGPQAVSLHVFDNTGLKSLTAATATIHVLPDEPPVAKLEVVPIGLRGQTYRVYNRSYTTDGDAITTVEYRMRYDANNNGFSDDSWTTLSGDHTSAAFTPTRVGKYQLYIKVTESYGQSDDTLSDALASTTIDIQNLAPEVSFQLEGSTPQPDHSPITIYTPQQIYGWGFTQVNAASALPGKAMRWTAGDALSGGIGKKGERYYNFNTSGMFMGYEYQYSWVHPFTDNGFGTTGSSPYRPIKVNDPNKSQPLLVPASNGSWQTVELREDIYTTPRHMYFTQHNNKFYALNKGKIGAYNFEYGFGGTVTHHLPNGSYYDYIINLMADQTNDRYVTRSRDGVSPTAPWQVYTYGSRPAGGGYQYFMKDPRIQSHVIAQDLLYMVVTWYCECGAWDDYWGQYDTLSLQDLRVYDLFSGALRYSSMEQGHRLFGSTDDFKPSWGAARGDQAVFINDVRDRFIQFDREGKTARSGELPMMSNKSKSSAGQPFVCRPESRISREIYEGVEGDIYFYNKLRCYDSNGVHQPNQDEVYVVKLNPDFTAAWRTQLTGNHYDPRHVGLWNGNNDATMIVNPLKGELITRTYAPNGVGYYEYFQRVNTNNGSKISTNAAQFAYTHNAAVFDIDHLGNYVYRSDGTTGAYSYTNYGIRYKPLSDGSVVQYRSDGSMYSSFSAGGPLSGGGGYVNMADGIVNGDYIGDGMFLSLMHNKSHWGTAWASRVAWLNVGTPADGTPVSGSYGLSLGQFLSPFNVSNHEIGFTMTLRDADYDTGLAGMSFRAQDPLRRYALEADGARLYLSRYNNGTRTVLAQSNYAFADNVSVSFTIKAVGSRIEVFVNGAPYFNVTDSTWTSGKMGPFSDKSFIRFGAITTKEAKNPEAVWGQDYAVWDAGTAKAEVRLSSLLFYDPEGDPAGPYQWKYTHTPKFIANQGLSALHNTTSASAQLLFDKVGVYQVRMSAQDDPHPSYRYPNQTFAAYRKSSNEFLRSITVHRRPVAAFTLALNSNQTVNWIDASYDPDRWASTSSYSPAEDGKNYQSTRGIFDRKYYYITPSGTYVASQLLYPSEAGTYRAGMAVMDEYGAWSDFVERSITVTAPLPVNRLPTAAVTYPGGSQASPTATTNRRPQLQWTQTDPDAGTVFTKFQFQIADEVSTAYVLDTGELSQNTTSTSRSWTVNRDLPTAKKLQVRVRVNDGKEWSAWSPYRWMMVNNAPQATLTFPAGSSSNPTALDTRRPAIQWTQTDPDSDAVFQMYEVQIRNEAGTATVATSGQVPIYTTQAGGSWTVPADLPAGKLRARVRVYDGAAWSAWSAERWMAANRPPNADFSWSPTIVFEGDDVTLTNGSTDPDAGDTLSYVWTITRPDGSSFTRTTASVALPNVMQGVYTVRLRATDAAGAFDEATKTFLAGDLAIVGEVGHTPEWEQYRQSWNIRFPARARSPDTFWAGEVFLLRASVTDTGTSATKPASVTATLVGTGAAAGLTQADNGGSGAGSFMRFAGEMVETAFAKALEDGAYTIRFQVVYTNGHIETHDVPLRVEGSIHDVIVVQQRL